MRIKKCLSRKVVMTLTSATVATFGIVAPTFAERMVEIPSSINPVGSGAHALGLGGAFIAVADDATAASWNPAALTQLDKIQFSLVGGFLPNRNEDNAFGTNPEANHSGSVSDNEINFFSLTLPLGSTPLKDMVPQNTVVSLSYQQLYEFNRDWDFNILRKPEDGDLVLDINIDYEQKGQLSAYSLAVATKATDMLSLGASLNIWRNHFDNNYWEQHQTYTAKSNLGINLAGDVSDNFEFEGINANFGFLLKLDHSWRLGGVIKTPFTADLKHTSTDNSHSITTVPDFHDIVVDTKEQRSTDETLDMPMSYGLGLSYNLSSFMPPDRKKDDFFLTLDLYRTEWDDFIRTDANGIETQAMSDRAAGDSTVDPTTWVRFGGQYTRVAQDDSYNVPFRFGLFYDPAPAEGTPDDYYGMSLGTGYDNNRFMTDIAYQYRFGNDVGGAGLEHLNMTQDVQEHKIFLSLIYRLGE